MVQRKITSACFVQTHQCALQAECMLLNVKPDVRKVKPKPQSVVMKLLFISR
jgi:hypothetical protein